MPKLTDTQAVLLSAAARRQDGTGPPPLMVAGTLRPKSDLGKWALAALGPRSGAGDLSTGLPGQRKRCCEVTGLRVCHRPARSARLTGGASGGGSAAMAAAPDTQGGHHAQVHR